MVFAINDVSFFSIHGIFYTCGLRHRQGFIPRAQLPEVRTAPSTSGTRTRLLDGG